MRFASLASPALSAVGALCGGACLLHGNQQRIQLQSLQKRLSLAASAVSEFGSAGSGDSSGKAVDASEKVKEDRLLDAANAIGVVGSTLKEETSRRRLALAMAAAEAAVATEESQSGERRLDVKSLASESSVWTVGRVESVVTIREPLSVDWRRLRLSGGGRAVLLSFSFTTQVEAKGSTEKTPCFERRQFSSTSSIQTSEQSELKRRQAEREGAAGEISVSSVAESWTSLAVGTPLLVKVDSNAPSENEDPRSEAVLAVCGGLEAEHPQFVVLGSSGDGKGTQATALGCALLAVSALKAFLSVVLRRKL